MVTVEFPWGSLLPCVLGLDPAVQRGIASIVAPGGRIEILAPVVPTDHVDGMNVLDRSFEPRIAAAWWSAGFELDGMREASDDDVSATRSSWARRLGERPVWRLDLRRVRAT